MKRRSFNQLILLACCAAVAGVAYGQEGGRGPEVAAAANAHQPSSTDGEVHVLPIRGSVYMIVGAGGNITMQVGKEGVLLVDSGLASKSDKVLAAIRTITDAPIRYIINTDVHTDHTGGNAAIASQGITITDRNFGADIAGSSVIPGAKIVAHETVLDRLSSQDGDQPPAPSAGWPNDAYSTDIKKMYFNGEPLFLYHPPAAQTDGGTFVLLRSSDVISTGDLFTVDTYPFIDLKRGGDFKGLLAAVNHIIELSAPAVNQEGGTYIVPGHGRLCDQADIVEYQTMLTIIRDRVQDMVKRGLTLEQVKAARPTFEYDPHYGKTTGPWTTDMFVEAVYKSLKQ